MKLKQHPLLIGLLFLTLSFSSWAQIDVDKVMSNLHRRTSDMRLVCSHRGYMPYMVPENSSGAIQKAYEQGFEMIELDVRSTVDGVPVLMHDETVGRMVDGFNTVNNNPPVNQLTWDNLRWRKLKYSGTATTYNLPSFEYALDYIKKNSISMVVILDLKDVATAKRCWDIVKKKSDFYGKPAYSWVVFKMNPYLFTSVTDFEEKMGLVSCYPEGRFGIQCYESNWIDLFKYIPVFQTGVHFNKPSPISVYKALRTRPYFVAVEIGIKQPNRRLQNLLNEALKTNDGIVAFQPVQEQTNGRYFRRDGTCCNTLTDSYAKGDLPDTWDQRPSLDFLRNRSSCIISDNARILHFWLQERGLRHQDRLLKGPSGAVGAVSGKMASDESAPNENITVEPDEITESFSAYPNPSNGTVAVSLDINTEGVVQINLLDVNGNKVLVQNEIVQKGHNEIALPNLKNHGTKPGFYILQAITPDQKRWFLKLVLE